MREQFRPYTMLVGPINDLTASSVTLADTGGNALDCNYISVECSSAVTTGYYTARIFPTNITTPAANQGDAAAASGFTTSGFVGGASKMNSGYPVEFVLADNDRTSVVKIEQATAEPGLYTITYGQIWTGNPLRDGERPKGL